MIALVALIGAGLTCGTPQRAIDQLKDNVAQLARGRTKEDLRSRLGKDLSVLELSGDPSTGALHLVVAGRDGNRAAAQRVDCERDAAGRLVQCKAVEPISHTQYVPEAAWQRVTERMTVEEAYRLICRPGDPISGSPDPELATHEYLVLRTNPEPVSSCMARLLTRSGVIVQKEMLCE
jgi:hypothetical protein